MQSPGPPGWSVSRSSSGGLFAFAPQVDHRHQGWRHGDVDVDASEWKNQQHEYSTRRRAPTVRIHVFSEFTPIEDCCSLRWDRLAICVVEERSSASSRAPPMYAFSAPSARPGACSIRGNKRWNLSRGKFPDFPFLSFLLYLSWPLNIHL